MPGFAIAGSRPFIEKTIVRASSTLADDGGTVLTDFVKCQGARAVYFKIYSTTGSTAVFPASFANIRFRVHAGAPITTATQGEPLVILNGDITTLQANFGGIISALPTVSEAVTNVGGAVGALILLDEIALSMSQPAADIVGLTVEAYVIF